jgi:hypothetical protein
MLCPGRRAEGEGMVEKIHDAETQRCRDAELQRCRGTQYLYNKISSRIRKYAEGRGRGAPCCLKLIMSPPNRYGTSVSAGQNTRDHKPRPCGRPHEDLCAYTTV